MKLITFTDGGARGNPGPAASGIVIKDHTGKNISSFGIYLGIQTNNFAEYTGLIEALKKAGELGATEVDCNLDSELIVKQMRGEYKVKEPTLQKLFVKVYNLATGFKKVTYRHVPREQNKEADAEVNKTLDAQK
ncbi:MAG: ribonuclease HI family protein [Patescibacteria group bacterium]